MWKPQGKVQCVAWFIETKSDAQVRRNFGIQYGREPPPRPNVRAWYASIMETSSVGHKFGACRTSVSDANVAFGIGLFLYEPGYTLNFPLWRPHFSTNLRHLEN
ncbi:hypothetical protein AVEN_189718-1 [Araneus ventricosus]|uniref:Uncharacterized protein n=1 Tax=Araneus ventricosus TaxID=182803 RepID=A0A4Y2J0U9_ARAVE|nr:hypothetical protein AVEN_189718-1 [Araneus ventricosus]